MDNLPSKHKNLLKISQKSFLTHIYTNQLFQPETVIRSKLFQSYSENMYIEPSIRNKSKFTQKGRNTNMKFYIRELPQKQYHYQSYDKPEVSNESKIKPEDIWCSNWFDYHIDKVTYNKGDLNVFATATRLQKLRSNTCYKKNKNKKEN